MVSTASYEARAHGVRSGTPLRVAARRLPAGLQGAVFLPVDMETYERASAEVMQVLRSFPVDVEVLGWDEAFVGPPAGDRGLAAELAEELRAAVRSATGLTCSVGVGDNELQATATDFGKPDGVGTLRSVDWDEVMGPLTVDALWGIGSRTRARLEDLGIRTVADLAATPAADLAERFGPRTGPWLRRLGRGVDSSAVDPTPWVARGHSRELTLQEDTEDWAEVAEHARALAAKVADDVAREGRPATRVGVKIRFRPFITRQRSLTLPSPSSDPAVITEAVADLLGALRAVPPGASGRGQRHAAAPGGGLAERGLGRRFGRQQGLGSSQGVPVTSSARPRADQALDAGVRLGLVVYGVVHLLLAYTAIRLALGDRDQQASQGGRCPTWRRAVPEPPGWWWSRSGSQPWWCGRSGRPRPGHRDEDGAKRGLKRVSSAVRAVVYGALGVVALQKAFSSGSSGGGTDSMTRQVMTAPAGQTLVGLWAWSWSASGADLVFQLGHPTVPQAAGLGCRQG